MNVESRHGALALAVALTALGLVAVAATLPRPGASAGAAACHAPADVEDRIGFYSRQVAAHPRLYPTLALLGKAYLDRVRWTADARDLASARDCLERSIHIQPNLAAYKILAATGNYSHRFDEALRWCELASEVAPGDTEVLAMRTEALLALDRLDEAAAMLSEVAEPDTSFHAVACRGMLLSARGDRARALADFERAARLGQEQGFPESTLWARIASAALFLDQGAASGAEPYLRAAEQIAPDDYDLQVHLAEFEEGTGRIERALARYEHLLTLRCDAEIHRCVYGLAARLGQTDKAAYHFKTAERLWRAALDQGEVYPLQGLATLYCDAGHAPHEAVLLGERNLRYKRDASARETLERARNLAANR